MAIKGKTLKQSIEIQASAHEVYQAYMNATQHAKFTGSTARIKDEVGTKFNLGDGYIKGTNVELIHDKKIVQEWQADDAGWPKTHFSRIIIDLVEEGENTILKFKHTGIPIKCYEEISEGWTTYYWEPLKTYLENKEELD